MVSNSFPYPNTALFMLMFYFSVYYSEAQTNYYIVYFKDKNNSPYSLADPSQYLSNKAIERREKQNISLHETDLPVNPQYLSQLANEGAHLLYPLKWLNAAVIEATPSVISAINNLPIVKSNKKLNRNVSHTEDFNVNLCNTHWFYLQNINLTQLRMIGADYMHQEGYNGKDISIAVFDAGFKNADTLHFFKHLFNENRILLTYDLVTFENNTYNDHQHGTHVLSVLAAFGNSQLIGTAYKANYLLFRTEDAASEYEIEEANWARAVEMADSAGAYIISSSLGYSTFDNPDSDHSYADMNGNSTIITRYADIAYSKGMLVFNSAGNEGASSWKYLTAPADGHKVIAVGAVKADSNIAAFSSYGPSYDGRIKPDLVAMGEGTIIGTHTGGILSGNGTSFSCPLVSGMAAALWQAFPDKTHNHIRSALLYSGSHFYTPDNRYGYGIPNFKKAYDYLNGDTTHVSVSEIQLFPNPLSDETPKIAVPHHLLNKKFNLRIHDVYGHKVMETSVKTTSQNISLNLPLQALKKGLYIFTFEGNNTTYIQKIIKY
ncbi:MAG: S8 family serine peptidase [Cytophagaceae bacterium]|nr:S8 family serine peptidase [Cytophagaceae bacterium]MDW8457208.1 S8 family serine peptidase [Cytophagaceae bacterium]